MGPVKFDDLPKVAADALGDDYQVNGFQFKSKHKTNWDGAVVTTAVDLFGKDCSTPAKMTWKFPSPLGCTGGFAIDKLEMDKAGKFKFEASLDKTALKVPDMKMDIKSDLVDMSKATVGVTYTGVKDAQIKVETKPMNPTDLAFEATYSLCPPATLGVKFTTANIMSPDLGLQMAQGPMFAAILAKENLSAFSAHAHYKVSDELNVAAKWEVGGKNGGQCCAGVDFEAQKGTKIKAKVDRDMSVSAAVKHDVSKGFAVLAGAKYAMKGGAFSYGLALNIE